jgi:hypothetical protein
MDMMFPPSGEDRWRTLCLETMLLLKQVDVEEAARLVHAASQIPKYRNRPPDLAAADLLANCVVQPSLRRDAEGP